MHLTEMKQMLLKDKEGPFKIKQAISFYVYLMFEYIFMICDQLERASEKKSC